MSGASLAPAPLETREEPLSSPQGLHGARFPRHLFPLHMEPCCPGDSSATSLTACFPGQGSELPTSRNTSVRDDSLGFKREKIL